MIKYIFTLATLLDSKSKIRKHYSPDRTDLTLAEFAEELDKLPIISDELYPEFYDIKYSAMEQTQRSIELENKTDAESVNEMQRINEKFEELTDRLNVLLGNILVN